MRLLAPLMLLLPAVATAQSYTVQGKVDDVQGTQNQFVLDGTRIPVVSTALDLNLLQGQQSFLEVVNVGTALAPVLRIDAATPTNKVMDMGSLRLGQTSTCAVFAPAGSIAFLLLDMTDNTAFTPIPGLQGAWLLGFAPHLLAGGLTSAAGVLPAAFAVPDVPSLVGLEITSQALVSQPSGWALSNVDSKEVRP